MINLGNVSRFKAAGIHLGISAVIALGSLMTMLTLWYPPPYFKAMGGNELILLIVGVDVAIGPLITLIVFDARKKSLPFDLAVIATLQLAAFAYGMYAMQSGRPVFTVFTGERLVVVSAAEIDPGELAKGNSEEFRTLSLTGPRWVATEQPKDPQERNTLAFVGLTGFGIQQLPRYYVPFGSKKSEMLAAVQPIEHVLKTRPATGSKLNEYLSGLQGKGRDDIRCIPVKTRRGELLGIIDARSGKLLELL